MCCKKLTLVLSFLLSSAFSFPLLANEVIESPSPSINQMVVGPSQVVSIPDFAIELNQLWQLRSYIKGHLREMPLVLVLTSKGGILEDVNLFVNYFSEILAPIHFKMHKRPLVIVLQDFCFSACNILTTGLTHFSDRQQLRVLTLMDTQFGFHAPLTYSVESGNQLVPFDPAHGYSEKEEENRISDMLSAYLNYGIDGRWLSAHSDFFTFKGVDALQTLSAFHLCKDKSLIIPTDSCVPSYSKMFDKIELLHQ